MFNCTKCRKTSGPREKCHTVPVKTRTKHYTNGGVGTEIVKEEKMCKDCADEMAQNGN